MSWPTKLGLVARDIKLAHTVFAMPFALLGACLGVVLAWPVGVGSAGDGSAGDGLAGDGPWGLSWFRLAGHLGLVVACMVFARTFAMVVNRVVDRRFDAKNPRTRGRAFASGRLSGGDGLAVLAGSAGLFVMATAGFGLLYGNWVPLVAGPGVLGSLGLYSYTKRFTALCHGVLGVALALSPVAGGVAVGGLEGVGGVTLLLAGFVACWVAGFDVIYAIQDEAFDRAEGLRSIPAALGARGAAWASRGLHGAAAGLLVAMAVSGPLGWVFAWASAAAVGLLIAEHAILAARGPGSIPLVFFTLNGVVAIVLGAAGMVDLAIGLGRG